MRSVFRKIRLFAVFYGLVLILSTGSLRAARIEKGPYLQLIAPDGVTVCWTTDEAAAGSVRYGQDDLDLEVRESEPARAHRVRLKGLNPADTYRYQVLCGSEESKVFSFKTAPLSGGGFTFVAYGDNRTNAGDHRKVVNRILALKPDLVVNTGDLVENGHRPAHWDTFFQVAGPLMAQAPYYPSLGNHEGNSSIYFNTFALPGKERYYSFEYGNCHFVALDSNEPYLSGEAQRRWLIEDLSRNQDAAFRIVFFHHPPYTRTRSEDRQRYAEQIRDRWQKIFETYHVDIVLNGHDHNYQRAVVKGIQYIVTGGGGAPRYAVGDKKPWSVKAASVLHCVSFNVKEDSIQARVIIPDGRVIDMFNLTARQVR